MAQDNYSYKKYQKELAQKKKREAKIQRKLDKKNIQVKEVVVLPDGGSAVSLEGSKGASDDTGVVA